MAPCPVPSGLSGLCLLSGLCSSPDLQKGHKLVFLGHWRWPERLSSLLPPWGWGGMPTCGVQDWRRALRRIKGSRAHLAPSQGFTGHLPTPSSPFGPSLPAPGTPGPSYVMDPSGNVSEPEGCWQGVANPALGQALCLLLTLFAVSPESRCPGELTGQLLSFFLLRVPQFSPSSLETSRTFSLKGI